MIRHLFQKISFRCKILIKRFFKCFRKFFNFQPKRRWFDQSPLNLTQAEARKILKIDKNRHVPQIYLTNTPEKIYKILENPVFQNEIYLNEKEFIVFFSNKEHQIRHVQQFYQKLESENKQLLNKNPFFEKWIWELKSEFLKGNYYLVLKKNHI